MLAPAQAPGTPIIARQVTPTTIIKQGSPAQTTVQATTTLQRPPVLQVRPTWLSTCWLGTSTGDYKQCLVNYQCSERLDTC